LDLYLNADGFLGDSGLAALGARLVDLGHEIRFVRSVLAETRRGVAAWHDEIAAFVREGAFDIVVLPRAWDAAIVDVIRAELASGVLVRLTNGVSAGLDDRFDRVLDDSGLVALVEGSTHVANATFKKTTARELRRLVTAPAAPALAAAALSAAPDAGHRPMLSGPASGCPFLLDAAQSPIFARLALDPTKVQTKGCTFCLDNSGAFAVPSEAAVLDAWLDGLRSARARDPSVREFLLTDERPHPYLPAFFRAVRDEGLGPVELMIKSRVDWLLEFADGPVSEAITLAETTGSLLHVYLVGFENFDPFHLALFNKGSTVADNVAAIEKLRELAARFPRSFEYLRYRAHGIVLFTPWTLPEHLLENARRMREVRFHELRTEAVRTRLRLYPRVPLHALAEADGLLVDRFEEGRGDRAAEQGYDASVPWRFKDARTEVVFRLATWLSSRDRMLMDADALEAATSFVLRWPGLAEVPEDAQLPFDQAIRAWAPGCEGSAAATVGFDPEVDLVASGDKPACLKEGVPAAAALRLVRAYGAMGLSAAIVERHDVGGAGDVHRSGDRFAIVAVARDAATLAAVVDAQRAHHAREGAASGSERLATVGELMGYPRCCREAFAQQAERGDNLENERLTLLRSPGARVHPLLNRLARVRLISHHPCTADCAASIAIAREVLARCAAISPDAALWVQRELERPVLYLDYGRSLYVRGRFEGDAFLVDEAELVHRIFHRRVGADDFDPAKLASFTLRPSMVIAHQRDGRRFELSAPSPLLLIPGVPLPAPALAALEASHALREARVATLASPAGAPVVGRDEALPAAIRPGVRVLGYRILSVNGDAGTHRITLKSASHQFDVRVWNARRLGNAERAFVLSRGAWRFQVDLLDQLPAPARAALDMLARALPMGPPGAEQRTARPASRTTIIDVPSVCERACVFCHISLRPLDQRAPRGSADDVERAISAAKDGDILFTGDDALANPRIVAWVELATRGGGRVSIIGPPRRGRTAALAPALARAGLHKYVTALLGPSADVHDRMAGLPGAFEALEEAMRAMHAASVTTELVTPLIRPLLADLPAMADLAVRLSHSGHTLVAYAPDSMVGGGFDPLVPPFDELRTALGKLAGKRVSVDALPTCVVPPAQRPRDGSRLERTDGELGVVYPQESCAACAAKSSCPGVAETVYRAVGARGLVPAR
jgi:MoaA/NifB/PqqE/SkfB family radical SAM enzyme